MKEISRLLLQQHNSKESAWIAVDNKVYDITDFAAIHPGGEQILLQSAGLDVTGTWD
jgi:cytochrome b involved in lipid metabolism